MKKIYLLNVSNRKDKKYMIYEINNLAEQLRVSPVVHFGAIGYEDYTDHKDSIRRDMYIMRHEKREDWTKKGVDSAGFWSRWILWNKPDLKESIIDTMKRFDIKIII